MDYMLSHLPNTWRHLPARTLVARTTMATHAPSNHGVRGSQAAVYS